MYTFAWHLFLCSVFYVMGPGMSVFILQAVRDGVFETPFRGPVFLIPQCLYSHGECGRGVWPRSSQSWLPVTTSDELFLPPPNHCTLTVGFHLESESSVRKFACDTYIYIYTRTFFSFFLNVIHRGWCYAVSFTLICHRKCPLITSVPCPRHLFICFLELDFARHQFRRVAITHPNYCCSCVSAEFLVGHGSSCILPGTECVHAHEN